MAHHSLRNHRKTNYLMRKLGIPRYAAVGVLELLFNSAYECDAVMADGCLTGWTTDQIAAAAEWEGEPRTFVLSLISAGFLEVDDDNYYLHDYFVWCPDYVKKRINRRLQPANEVDGGQRQKTADNGGQRTPKSANVCLGKVREGKVSKDSPPTPQGEKDGGGIVVCNGKSGTVTTSMVAENVVTGLGMAAGPVSQMKSIEAVARRIAKLDLSNDQKRDLANELHVLAKEIGSAAGIKNPPALWIKRASERIAEFEK